LIQGEECSLEYFLGMLWADFGVISVDFVKNPDDNGKFLHAKAQKRLHS
jgi:hypothetical protein